MPNPAGRPRIYPDVTLICRKCEQPFTMRGGVARGYKKRHGVQKPYCSMKCFYEGVNRHAYDPHQSAPTYVCEGCGGTFARRADVTADGQFRRWDIDQKYHSVECFRNSLAEHHESKRASGYLPAGHVDSQGYHIVKWTDGKNVKVHRIVMERKLGRPLRGKENVHYVNGIRSDNRPENLELWVKAQPCGQRLSDHVERAIEFIREYPEEFESRGYRIIPPEGDGDAALVLQQHETS